MSVKYIYKTANILGKQLELAHSTKLELLENGWLAGVENLNFENSEIMENFCLGGVKDWPYALLRSLDNTLDQSGQVDRHIEEPFS